MATISKVLLIFAISMAIATVDGQVLAKTLGPGQVKTSGKSVAPSGTGGGQSQKHACHNGGTGTRCIVAPRPGTTLPPCRGPHMGPNGVMIQCK